MPSRRNCGPSGEELAVQYLQEKGYKILERNYRFEHGEIDIVALDGQMLVFVEVKARRSTRFGEPEEAMTDVKVKNLCATADGYMFEHKMEDQSCRFDVIAIKYNPGASKPVIRHHEHAIQWFDTME